MLTQMSTFLFLLTVLMYFPFLTVPLNAFHAATNDGKQQQYTDISTADTYVGRCTSILSFLVCSNDDG